MQRMRRFVVGYTPAAIGVLLAYTGIYKLVYPAEATAALTALDFPRPWAILLIVVITILEMYLGVILLLKIDLRCGLIMVMALLMVFSIFLFFLSTMAHPPSCGCMGLTAVFTSNRHNAIFGLLRNCVLLWLLKGAYNHYFPPTRDATLIP